MMHISDRNYKRKIAVLYTDQEFTFFQQYKLVKYFQVIWLLAMQRNFFYSYIRISNWFNLPRFSKI